MSSTIAKEPELSDVTGSANKAALKYPISRTGDVTDNYHGRVVADPYRWLEDVESDETSAWVTAQNECTQAYLGKLPERDRMRQTLETLWNYPRTSRPVLRGNAYFFTHNDGLQNQAVLYVAPAGTPASQLLDHASVLIDPNTLSDDGTMSLASWVPSDDGRKLAYSIADGGSDWRTWYVIDVESMTKLPDVVRWSKFSGATWTPDGTAFYYSRYAEPSDGEELTGTNEKQMLYKHTVGTVQAEDELVFAKPEHPKWGFGSSVTEDGRYLLINNWKGTEPKTQYFIRDLSVPDGPIRGLIQGFDADFTFIGSIDSVLYFLTDESAPQQRVIGMDVEAHLASVIPDVGEVDQLSRADWMDVVETSEDVIEDVSLLGKTFFISYLHDALSQVKQFDVSGKFLGEIVLPGAGSVSGFGGLRTATETFYTFTNYVTPPTIYRIALNGIETDRSGQRWLRPDVAFDVDSYITEQTFATSPDGTRVPVLITRHRDAQRNADNRTLLYAYGGFNISLTPSYSPAIASWLDAGGIYAVANLRGGGEYGSQWHEAGMKLGKQNVFDDFIAAAEHLIDLKWTCNSKLGIRGGSNGGLLVGAVMTQRPDLFGACLPAVGVMDMLRYQKFTIGWAWVDEFGSSDDPSQIDNLLSYSPLHNIEVGTCYPATLVTTADRDDRVVPGHSFKFAAALQAAQSQAAASCNKPTLIRIETRAGHGAGTPTSKRIEEYADLWAFLLSNLN
ncbi:MAG: prolyl oligopeptidase family serine peptidase [Planctomycetota bacterium]